jgi:lipopolysaccharide/colanic/teichoic acid biosynthesis glycosyltransferase
MMNQATNDAACATGREMEFERAEATEPQSHVRGSAYSQVVEMPPRFRQEDADLRDSSVAVARYEAIASEWSPVDVLQLASDPALRATVAPRPSSSVASDFHRRLEAGQELIPADGNLSAWYLFGKRLLDVLGAAAALTVLSPLLVFVAVILFVTTRGRPFFRQTRLGYRGRPFAMYKFRTMALDAATRQAQVANEHSGPIFKNRRDPRITRIGRFLRKTSIDELPQLIHVLLGQMSLVGPRPPVPAEVARYEPWQRQRLAVKPGLTCLWQISGRSEIGFNDWIRMDLWYINHQNLGTDLSLLIRTPWSVLTGRGAY